MAISRFLMDKEGYLYVKKDSFYGVKEIIKSLQKKYDKIIASVNKYNLYDYDKKELEKNKIAFTVEKTGESYWNYKTVLTSIATYSEWIEANGGDEFIYRTWLGTLRVKENVPEYEQVKDKVKDKHSWNFYHVARDFKFGLDTTVPIMSLNPLGTTCKDYIGTVDEVRAYFGKLPKQVKLIVNNPTTAQSAWLFRVTARGSEFIATDVTSGTGHICSVDTEWEPFYV